MDDTNRLTAVPNYVLWVPSVGHRYDVRSTVNRGLRKGIRRGLGMKKYESISGRFKGMFQEAIERTKTLKTSFLKKAFYSVNSLVRGLLFLVVDKKLQLGMMDR